jgi:hypothetical protein
VVDERALAVARRAAEQAAAVGVSLPDDLRLWELAGGRPPASPVRGDPEELGRLLEASTGPDERQRRGAHYTPAALAEEVAASALAGRVQPTVGDPACGGGALLLAAARHLAASGEHPTEIVGRLWGADIDPVAVATTEVALSLWAGSPPPPARFSVADALHDDLPWPALDVVLGNPPFLTPLGARAARSGADGDRLRARFGAAVRPYTDVAGLFLLRGCQLARSDGTVAMVQPQSVLAARDASGVREAVDATGRLRGVLVPARAGFEAAVEVCIPIVDLGRPGDGGRWSARLASAHGVPAVDLDATRRVGHEATTTGAFRSEYYGMVDHVHEEIDLPSGRPIVTTGLVDLGVCHWGARPARIGGRAWERPVLDVSALEGRAAAWVRRTGGPKLVVATQTPVVEVVVDEHGDWVAGVPLVVVVAPSERLWPLAAALAAPAVTAWLLARSAGTARTPRSLKVTASLLREVPLPSDADAWAAGAGALRAGDLGSFADAMSAAYGTGPDVAAWWVERARSVWSPTAVHR